MTTLPKLNPKVDFERGRIIEHAARVFLNRGYDGTTMDHIAREMGVTKGFIYYYFTSKAEVFYALHSRALQEAVEYVRQRVPASASPIAKLRCAIATHLELTIQRPAFGGVALRTAWVAASPKVPTQYRRRLEEQRDELYGVYRDIIQEGIQSGVFKPAEVSVLIQLVMGSLTWLPAWYQPHGRLEPGAVAGVLADMFLGPLVGPKSRRSARP